MVFTVNKQTTAKARRGLYHHCYNSLTKTHSQRLIATKIPVPVTLRNVCRDSTSASGVKHRLAAGIITLSCLLSATLGRFTEWNPVIDFFFNAKIICHFQSVCYSRRQLGVCALTHPAAHHDSAPEPPPAGWVQVLPHCCCYLGYLSRCAV